MLLTATVVLTQDYEVFALSNQPPLIATSMLSSIIVSSVGFAVSIVVGSFLRGL